MKPFLLFFLLIGATSANAQDLAVAARVTKTLTATERTLTLRKLSLGDSCTIIIPAAMDGWTVTADDVTIGNGVRIIGEATIGTTGTAGAAGANGSTTYGNCYAKDGKLGSFGGIGGNGGPGKNVSLKLKIRTMGTLNVLVPGGNGGSGGKGGNGGNGAPAICAQMGIGGCDAGRGGDGTRGGTGGNGGPGGNVTINHSRAGSGAYNIANITIINAGGAGGPGGLSGSGGLGGAAARNCGSFSSDRPAGSPGSTNIQGNPGIAGAAGTKTVAAF